MKNQTSTQSRTRNRLMAAAASLAIAGAIGLGAVTTGTAPVLAEAVRVEGQHAAGFADVVEKVMPAVVSVRVQAKVDAASERGSRSTFGFDMPGFDDLPNDHPLKRFFREFRGDHEFRGDRGPRSERRAERDQRRHGQREGQRERTRPLAQGSGFFISGDGYIVTNNHVVEGGQSFTVVLDDGSELEAKLVGADKRTDLAVLKVDAKREFTYVAFAEDGEVRVGDWVVAIGNPFGLGGTVTAGIVSARGRDIGAGPYDDFIQIDAAVNRGNSGGPAFNLSGEVVGINTAIFSPSGGNVGIAFAIPASTAKEVIGNLIENGSVLRGWLGVQIQPVTDEIAESVGLDKARGALVTDAQADGPARDAGVRAGDVVTAINGKDVASPRELARTIGALAPSTKVEVTLWRGGSEQKVSVELGKLPGEENRADASGTQAPDEDDTASAATLDDFGLTVAPADGGEGLVVTDVDAGSPAAERGIQPGDVIVSVNSAPVASADDVDKAVEAATSAGRKAVLVQVTRDDANRFVALPLADG
jgi:serine protease Do